MARVFTAGAEEGKGYQGALQRIFSWADAGCGVYSLEDGAPAAPRTGRFCYKADNSGGTVQHKLAYACIGATELYVGLALFNLSNNAAYSNTKDVYFPTADAGLVINWNTATAGWYYGSTLVGSTFTLTYNQWNYVEIHFIPSTTTGGTITIKVNGVQVLNSTAAHTASANTVDGVYFQSHQGGTNTQYDMWYDDIVVNDASGTVNNTWPGQVRLFPLQVVGAGNHAGLVRKGIDLGYNLSQAREALDYSSWLEGSAVGDYDLYMVDSVVPPVGGVITNIIVTAIARAQASGVSLKPMIRSVATESEGTAIALASGWQSQQAAWAADPATTVAWVAANLATLQIGVKLA